MSYFNLISKIRLIVIFFCPLAACYGQHDWDDIAVPASPGSGMIWQLQEDVSDDFNYNFEATSSDATFGNKWINWYHNTWTGPLPTVWKRNNVSVQDGQLQIAGNRQNRNFVNVNGQSLSETNTGCVTSTKQIEYPVYIESRAKVMNSVLACATWLLSPDDTREIDFLEAYGGERWNNPWFNPERVHLSHHVFIRDPFTDWQPHDEGSFYTDGTTIWKEEFHTYGVYWRDPWHLEYYVDGKLVRVRSGKDQIDPVYHTNSVNPGNTQNDTRTGFDRPMDIIIDTEDQGWRAVDGLTPTDAELRNTDDHTFKVDWIRVYKPITGEVGMVTGVELDKTEVETFVGEEFTLFATTIPNNALNQEVSWSSDNEAVATVDAGGKVTGIAAGSATITVTSDEGSHTATCLVNVSAEKIVASVEFDNESKYLEAEFTVGSKIEVQCEYHAGSGNTIIDGGIGGVKFWLREIEPGWSVANDYVMSDSTTIGQESGTASAIISLEGVPPLAEIPAENWYFLFILMATSDGQFIEKGIWPINIVESTNTYEINDENALKIFPSPTFDFLNLEGLALDDAHEIKIYDSSGKLVATYANKKGRNQISIAQLQTGYYVLTLSAEKIHARRFIKH